MKKHTHQRIIYLMTLVLIFTCSTNLVLAQADSLSNVTKKYIIPPPPPPSCSNLFIQAEEMPIWGVCQNESKNEQQQCSNKAILKFVQDNLQYPEKALLYEVSGTAVVAFIVEKDGSMNNITLARRIGYGTDEEALRIVNLMASSGIKWKPAKQRGQNIRLRFNLPVRFKFDG